MSRRKTNKIFSTVFLVVYLLLLVGFASLKFLSQIVVSWLYLILPIVGFLLWFVFHKLIEQRDPQVHMFMIYNVVIILLAFLALVPLFMGDYAARLALEHNAQVDSYILEGDLNGCIEYLETISKDGDQARTICHLRIAIAKQDEDLCIGVLDPALQDTCYAYFE